MKRVLFLLSFMVSLSLSGRETVLPVVPYPAEVVIGDGTFNALDVEVTADPDFPEPDRSVICGFSKALSDASASALSEGCRPGRGVISFLYEPSIPSEEYAIKIGKKRIEVLSGSYSGTLYAIATLKQLLPLEIYGGRISDYMKRSWEVPCCHIADRPRFSWRGAHLDCSRHFFSIEEVKKYLDVMAVYKLNRFHWHLTDDHGWRIEIKKYPLLTETGAWRPETMIGWDATKFDGKRHGGYYTQEELRDVVAYAARLGIEIVPEFDLPAHMVSALKAYPHLGCTGGPYELMTVWDIAKDVLCVGKESSFEFLEAVFDELCEIFPYEYIHIGGDECPKLRWETCPHCQNRIEELGLKDSGVWSAEHYLQNYVTSRVQDYLASKGRRVIGWDEILEGELATGATIMSWRGTAGGIKGAENGFDVIMTPCEICYLNYCQGPYPELEPVGFHEYVPIRKCYDYEPLAGIPESAWHHILGVQCNVWTEFISTPQHMEYMLLPRMLAISEVQWTPAVSKDYERFRSDVITHQLPLLRSLGYEACYEITSEE
ncbi:MAG: beta-N-acetylhexosaminidase [Bacteroidales bacterium]|nr:beta-N-acetylhexosaminidase [Bacteroidales bacterium]